MYLRLDRDGGLYKLLTDFLAAYQRRTDVMEANTDVALQRQIDQLTADLKGSTDSLQQAVDEDGGTKK